MPGPRHRNLRPRRGGPLRPFREHPSIALLRTLREQRHIAYNAVVEAGLAGAPGDWSPVVPLSPRPASLDPRWDATSLRQFLQAARRFERDTGARAFFAGQRGVHAEAEARIRANLGQRLDLGWYLRQLPAHPVRHFVIVPGLLDGLNSYAVRMGDTVYGVLGTPIVRAGEAIDYPADAQLALLVHEFHHIYLNPWVDAHMDVLAAPAQRLFDVVAPTMRGLAYGEPRILLYESLVRANTLRYLRHHGEDAVLRRTTAEDQGKGFPWTPALADLLDAADTAGQPRFDAGTATAIAALLDEWAADDGARIAAEQRRLADTQARLLAQGPQLVALVPADGSRLSAGDGVLELRFDRPMDGRIAIFGEIPPVTAKPAWDAAKQVLRIPVRLEAGARYRLLLNSAQDGGFTSQAGEKLAPRTWTFAIE
ncbi:MAG: DUF4932 domain-containing protein [Thermomonas sp.]